MSGWPVSSCTVHVGHVGHVCTVAHDPPLPIRPLGGGGFYWGCRIDMYICTLGRYMYMYLTVLGRLFFFLEVDGS